MSRSELAGIPAVDVWRGPRIESTHAVAACVCTASGEVRFSRGTIDVPVFLRSSAKPFIAAAVVASGAVERFGLEGCEIAVMAGSHNGEPAHLEAVAAILAKIGASERDLQCGEPAPGHSRLEHNCSGKHAGILALARTLDAPLATYLAATHPAEAAILAFCARVFGEPLDATRVAVDGCGIPVIAVTLRAAARAFARFAVADLDRCGRDLEPADRAALEIVCAAMVAFPWFVAGTDRFDTDLMRVCGGDVVSKSGAEGVQGIGIARTESGMALKVVDGARRAADCASLSVLHEAGVLTRDQERDLERYARVPIENAAGRAVGEIVARSSWMHVP